MTNPPLTGLDRLRELAEKATPGPWRRSGRFVRAEGTRRIVSASEWHGGDDYPDAAFIAAVSPEVVLVLCDVAEAARKNWAQNPWYVNESLARLSAATTK